MTYERALRLYSVEVEQWWDGSGEGDQLLSAREWLEERIGELSEDHIKALRLLDEGVVKRAAVFKADSSWDVMMLRKTAKLAAAHSTHA